MENHLVNSIQVIDVIVNMLLSEGGLLYCTFKVLKISFIKDNVTTIFPPAFFILQQMFIGWKTKLGTMISPLLTITRKPIGFLPSIE